MKLVIPPECQIGAHRYKIRISDKILDVADLRAQIDSKENIIRLATRHNSTMFCGLIHEMLHAALHCCGQDSRDEVVSGPVEFITMFLLSLGIEPDFSQIPKEE